MSAHREQQLATAFVDLADVLPDDFDVIDLLHRLADHAVGLLGVDECGALLFSPQGDVVDATASSELARRVGLAQIQLRQGPCWDCIQSGDPTPDIFLVDGVAHRRWPQFASLDLTRQFTGIAAVPMMSRGLVIGALGFFHTRRTSVSLPELRLGQALADAATAAILNHRGLDRHRQLSEQLQTAFDSRVVVEQAKGMLAQRANIGLDTAFERMRRHARHRRQRLTVLARHVIDVRTELLAAPPA